MKNKKMNKNMLKVALVAVVTLVSVINVFNAQKSETLSDVAMANVEALADKEMVVEECVSSPGDECAALYVTPEGSCVTIYYDHRYVVSYL